MSEQEILWVTKGNEFAARFLESFAAFCHIIDDVVDGDKQEEVTDKRLVWVLVGFYEEVALNPWAKEFAPVLWPVIVSSANTWVFSNECKESKEKHIQIAGDVLKSQWHDVVWMVARICGGREHMDEVMKKQRGFDFELGTGIVN